LTPIFQLTTATLKISTTKIEVSDISRGSAGSLAIGRELVLADIPGYQRIERGYK
jgi:hypothetical protein